MDKETEGFMWGFLAGIIIAVIVFLFIISSTRGSLNGKRFESIQCTRPDEAIYFQPNPPYDIGCVNIRDLKESK